MMKRHKGFITIYSVIILGIVGVAITITTTLWIIGNTQTSSMLSKYSRARNLADACAEEAIQRLRSDQAYVGNQSISLNTDTCVIGPVQHISTEEKIVKTSATVDNIYSKLELHITNLTGKVVIGYWKDVAN